MISSCQWNGANTFYWKKYDVYKVLFDKNHFVIGDLSISDPISEFLALFLLVLLPMSASV